jgi:hypothetical protein
VFEEIFLQLKIGLRIIAVPHNLQFSLHSFSFPQANFWEIPEINNS